GSQVEAISPSRALTNRRDATGPRRVAGRRVAGDPFRTRSGASAPRITQRAKASAPRAMQRAKASAPRATQRAKASAPRTTRHDSPPLVWQELAGHGDLDPIPLRVGLLLDLHGEIDRAHDAVAEGLLDDVLERQAVDLEDLVEAVQQRIDRDRRH